jgi:hypothetical protein
MAEWQCLHFESKQSQYDSFPCSLSPSCTHRLFRKQFCFRKTQNLFPRCFAACSAKINTNPIGGVPDTFGEYACFLGMY